MHELIDEILEKRVVHDESGQEHELKAHVERNEVNFLYDFVSSDPSIVKALEVGCAYGLSSLAICSALAGRESAHHTILDPNQTEQWSGIGVANLKRAGFDFFEFIEKPSEYGLPEICQQGTGNFDFVFIDGYHTFDHTLIDLFYSNRLVRVGGYILVDDCSWPGVAKAVSYVANYPAYQIVGQSELKATTKKKIANAAKAVVPNALTGYLLPRNLYDRYYTRTMFSKIVALKKVAEDERNWKWFEPF